MTELQQKYLIISQDITQILEDIKKNWSKYPDYLGSAVLNSPIFEEPDILFIGINPGPGRFIQWNGDNWNQKKNQFIDPSKMILPPDSKNLWRSQLQWLKSDNARNNGEWWDFSKNKKNYYPYYMCELLVRIYRHDFPNTTRKELTDIFESRIMDTNLFPMSTFTTRELDRLISNYAKANNINIKTICLKQTVDLVKLVKPRSIVLLGNTVYDVISKELDNLKIPYYCINRKVGWHAKENILKMANDIYKMINSQK